MSVTNLSVKLAEFRKLSRDRMQTVVEKSLIRSGTSVIVESPVDQGRFVANWLFAFGDYQEGSNIMGPFRGEGERQGVVNKLTSSIESIQLGATFFMTNSLPYAQRLEDGWSAKGSKMVDRAVINFPAIVADEVGKVR